MLFFDQGTASGIQAIERIKNTLKLDGVYGPLYELIDVDEAVEVAADIVAGQRYKVLMKVIVF